MFPSFHIIQVLLNYAFSFNNICTMNFKHNINFWAERYKHSIIDPSLENLAFWKTCIYFKVGIHPQVKELYVYLRTTRKDTAQQTLFADWTNHFWMYHGSTHDILMTLGDYALAIREYDIPLSLKYPTESVVLKSPPIGDHSCQACHTEGKYYIWSSTSAKNKWRAFCLS